MGDERKLLIQEMERIRAERDQLHKMNELWISLLRNALELFSLQKVGPFRHRLHVEAAQRSGDGAE